MLRITEVAELAPRKQGWRSRGFPSCHNDGFRVKGRFALSTGEAAMPTSFYLVTQKHRATWTLNIEQAIFLLRTDLAHS